MVHLGGYNIGQNLHVPFTCVCCSIYVKINNSDFFFLQIVDKTKRDPTEEIEVRITIPNNIVVLFQFMVSCSHL